MTKSFGRKCIIFVEKRGEADEERIRTIQLFSFEVSGSRRGKARTTTTTRTKGTKRTKKKNAQSIDVSIRHPRTGTCHRSKNKNERLESSSDSLSEWSDSEEEEEKRKGGRIRREGTISSPKQTEKGRRRRRRRRELWGQ